jgi:hypothetical protein
MTSHHEEPRSDYGSIFSNVPEGDAEDEAEESGRDAGTASATGDPEEETLPFESVHATEIPVETVEDGLRLIEERWPWFLGNGPDLTSSDADALTPEGEADQLVQEASRVPFVMRTLALFVELGEGGEGTELTASGALPADLVERALRLGGAIGPDGAGTAPTPNAMVGSWAVLQDGGWVRLEGNRIERAEGLLPMVDPRQAPEVFAILAVTLVTRLLAVLDGADAGAGGLTGGTDTLLALTESAGPSRVTLREPEADTPLAARHAATRADLDTLAEYGLVRREGGTYRSNSVVRAATRAYIGAKAEG